jgi:hypothetical protein
MPDISSLYPQPPQPGGNALLSDPAKAVGLLSGLQDLRLKQQQFNALAQQPEAALQGQNIQNQTSQMKQNEEASQIAAHYFGTLPDDAKPDDIYRMKMAIRAVHPNISADTINTVANVALRDPTNLKNGIATLRTMGLSPEAMVSRVPGPPGPQGQPVTVPQTSAVRAGAMATGLAPGVGEAQVATGAGSGAALNEARHRGLNYRQEVFPLEVAIPALEKLGKTGTGPGTEELNHVKSFLQSAGIPGLDADKIKTFDEAKKYLTDFVNQNGNTGTNDKLAASFAGNPSVGISNAAATDVAKSALALRRMKQAQLVEFEKSGLPDSEFAKWASRWQLGHDPRAYGFDMMAPDQRKKVLESLPEGKNGAPGPRDLFKLQVQAAHEAGIINPNGFGK